jgi:hypothetical protein
MQGISSALFLGFSRIERVDTMLPTGTGNFSPIFSDWFGTPVLLFVIRQCRVPIPCQIIDESVSAVRIRLTPGWEIDVPKQLILAVEEAAAVLVTSLN